MKMNKRKELGKQYLYYTMLNTRHEKRLREMGRPEYFKPIIKKLRDKIAELDNEKKTKT
tara:strand:+ start:570 stop:746 length:177 start_codon:yes stop_codon:yes gene_type:complete